MATFNARFLDDTIFHVSLNSETEMGADFGEVIKVADFNVYDGEYTIEPTDEVQIISTRAKFLADDIVVQPVSGNYGRISYNGYSLTIT